MKLQIANDLSLPVDVVTQTIAVLAKRRAGKSYTMRRLVEQLFKAGQQVVLVDPKGDQWGVRSAADGKAPGLSIVILGGERADVPLEAGSGEVVAKLVVEERVSVLLDLSLFRKHEVATFMTGFLENLYRLKAREIYRTPMMLVVDEADAVAPQKPQKGEERMLGAAEDIVRRGGQRGIGCVLVTQRSAVLNKNVLTQAQVLIALRTIAPQDLAAMNAWIDVHGSEEQKRQLMASLPSLPVGDAWVWSPGWPTVEGIFKRVHVLPIETYDSGASPDPGEKKRAEPKSVAEVDLDALKRQMSATIEKAKADDPRELRKQIADLKKELGILQASRNSTASYKSGVKNQDKPALTEKDREILAKLTERVEALRAELSDQEARLVDRVRTATAAAINGATADMVTLLTGCANDVTSATGLVGVQRVLKKLAAVQPPQNTPATMTQRVGRQGPVSPQGGRVAPVAATNRPASLVSPSSNGDGIPPAKQKILNGLAFLHGIGVAAADKTQLALIVGVSPTSGGYFNNLGGLRSAGLIDYPSGGTVALTAEGQAHASTDGVPSTTSELHDAIRAKLPPAKWRIVEALVDVYPRAMSKDDLAGRIGVSSTSGGFFNNLGSLRSLGLIDYPHPGEAAALPVLFLER